MDVDVSTLNVARVEPGRLPDAPDEPNLVYRYAEKLAQEDDALL
jgi:hypothetical protein